MAGQCIYIVYTFLSPYISSTFCYVIHFPFIQIEYVTFIELFKMPAFIKRTKTQVSASKKPKSTRPSEPAAKRRRVMTMSVMPNKTVSNPYSRILPRTTKFSLSYTDFSHFEGVGPHANTTLKSTWHLNSLESPTVVVAT